MTVTIADQVFVFLCCILSGLIIGVIFDLFRLSRKIIPTSDMVTYIEDIIFWVLIGAVALITVFECNKGQLRGFIFVGMLLGVVFYLTLFSKYILKTLEKIIKVIIKTTDAITKIIVKPIKVAVLLVGKPANKIYSIYRGTIKRFKVYFVKKLSELKRAKKIIKEKL